MALAGFEVVRMATAPMRFSVRTPPPGLEAETVTLRGGGEVRLSGWVVPPRGQPRGVVVLMHGIHASRWTMVSRARFLRDAGYASVLYDSRAHGESSGERITIGHLEAEDARAVFEFADERFPGVGIGVIAISMGGAAATLSRSSRPDALVVESVFSTLWRAVDNRVARRVGPLSRLVTPLVMIQFEPRLGIPVSEVSPLDAMAEVEAPVLVIGGKDDLDTRSEETQQMFDAAAGPKELWLVDDVDHGDMHARAGKDYEARVLSFLHRWMPPPARADRAGPPEESYGAGE